MRIAYVINSVEGGGAALPVPAVARVLASQGATVQVFVLTRRDGRSLPAIEAAGLPVQVREGGETDHLDALRWLDRRVSAWGPDLIWTSLTRATLLGQLVGLLHARPGEGEEDQPGPLGAGSGGDRQEEREQDPHGPQRDEPGQLIQAFKSRHCLEPHQPFLTAPYSCRSAAAPRAGAA